MTELALTHEESLAEASRILTAANWKADEGWGGFTYGTCVGGLAPDGNVYVKNWAAIPPGHPRYSEDTPDEAHEAAQWLADRYKAPEIEPDNALSLGVLEVEPIAPQEEDMGAQPITVNVNVAPVINVDGARATSGDSEAGAGPMFEALRQGGMQEAARETIAQEPSLFGEPDEAEAPVSESPPADEPAEAVEDIVSGGDEAPEGEGTGDVEGADAGPASGGLEVFHGAGQDEPGDSYGESVFDADYSEDRDEAEGLTDDSFDLGALEDFSTPVEEAPRVQSEPQQGGQTYIGLDDLDRRRQNCIFNIQKYALDHAPRMSDEQAARLRDLRSYVSGVSENTVTRASDDDTRRQEMDELEALLSHEIAWDTVLKAKTRFLVTATREEVESFDHEADWPV